MMLPHIIAPVLTIVPIIYPKFVFCSANISQTFRQYNYIDFSIEKLCNYAKYKGKNVNITADTSKFVDWHTTTGYARPAMNWAIATGVITGKYEGTKVDPQGTASRAEAASMIYKYCTKVK